jgi:hypothetical protein
LEDSPEVPNEGYRARARKGKLDRNQRRIRNEEAPQRKGIRRFLARPPPPSSPETIGGGGKKRLTIVSEIA